MKECSGFWSDLRVVKELRICSYVHIMHQDYQSRLSALKSHLQALNMLSLVLEKPKSGKKWFQASEFACSQHECRCAGVFADKMVTTEDGYELTWQVNVLAPYVLTSLLLHSVKERIVNVSSISAGSRMDFDNLNQVRPHHMTHCL